MNTNPYTPPQSEPSTYNAGGELPLASPWLRLAAALIDGLVVFVPNLILGKLLLKMPSISEMMEAAAKGPEAIESLMPSSFMQLLSQVLGLAVFIGINFSFLKNGQTIGKMALKLQIQNRATGALLSVQDIIIKRMLPLYGLNALASIKLGPLGNILPTLCGILILVNVLLIFRQGRNCLHDDIAGTKVVKLPG